MNESAVLAIEARLEWHSDHAAHVDRLLVNPPALQADGRWRAAGEEVLRGAAVTLDAAPWCQPCGQANIALQRPDLTRTVSEGEGLAKGRRAMGDHWAVEAIR